MIREPGGRLVAEARDLRALLKEREEQLARLEAELDQLDAASRARHDRQLRTARWSVRVLREQLQTEEERPT